MILPVTALRYEQDVECQLKNHMTGTLDANFPES